MNIKGLCIDKTLAIIDAIKLLDRTSKKILLVVESRNNALVGIVTDGDVRRWIIRNGSLNEAVEEVMNTHPICLKEAERDRVETIMKKNFVEAVPILGENGEVVDVVFWNDKFLSKLNYYEQLNLPVVIMAGGKGTRLYPYTKILPKPLIPIGDKTILERIIENFTEYECKEIYLTVNYKKMMIKAYLDEINKNYSIHCIEEEDFFGTAGSLSLLKNRIKTTFFVSNCDILVDANYSHIIKYHKSNRNKITMITSLKNYCIPYGIVHSDNNGNLKEIKEKPELNFQINTGLYVLEPEVLEDIPEKQIYHMTDLINDYIHRGKKVGIYPLTEKAWLDMGEIKEMENMIQNLTI